MIKFGGTKGLAANKQYRVKPKGKPLVELGLTSKRQLWASHPEKNGRIRTSIGVCENERAAGRQIGRDGHPRCGVCEIGGCLN